MELCGALIATISFVIPAIIFMTIVYKLLSKFKDNKKFERVMQNIRATTFANILISCIVIVKMIFLKEEVLEINNINWKCIILIIILIPIIKKTKLPTIFYIIVSGIIGIIFKIAV